MMASKTPKACDEPSRAGTEVWVIVGRGSSTLRVRLVEEQPDRLHTVRVTVFGPGFEKGTVTLGPLAVVRSPRSSVRRDRCFKVRSSTPPGERMARLAVDG